jgi:hypothetical protein
MRVLSRMMAVATLALAVAAVAGAADFTFRVPVALHRIPADIKTVSVSVAVYDATWDQEHPTVGDHRVGYGGAGAAIENGEFTDTMTVSFNASYELRKRPEEAVFYEVNLLLYGPPGYQGGCLSAMGLDGQYPYDTSQPILCQHIGRIDEPVPVQTRRKALPPADLLRRIKK